MLGHFELVSKSFEFAAGYNVEQPVEGLKRFSISEAAAASSSDSRRWAHLRNPSLMVFHSCMKLRGTRSSTTAALTPIRHLRSQIRLNLIGIEDVGRS